MDVENAEPHNGQVAPRRRTLALVALISAVALTAAVVVAVLALARAAQLNAQPTSPSASPTTTAPGSTTTPSPTSSPDPAVSPAPIRILVGTEGFVIAGAEGNDASFEFLWRDEPSEAVAQLTQAFGFEPEIGLQEGDGTHFPDYTVWRWDSFTLGSMVETPGAPLRDEYSSPAWLEFEANSVGDVELRADVGLEIGMTAAEVRAAGPDREYPVPNSPGVRFIFTDESSTAPDDGQRLLASVVAEADDADGTVVNISYRVLADF